MSTTIQGRPLPFEVTTSMLRFFTLAMGTPKEVADITVEFHFHGWLTVAVHPGGYEAGVSAKISETIYVHEGHPVDDLHQNTR